MRPEQERQVIEGLLGEEHRELYLHNPWFRSSIELFVRFLPALVEGLAAQARVTAERRRRDDVRSLPGKRR